MTEKQRFIAALNCKPITGHVPHYELVFFLTMESLGKIHPSQRIYNQWNQMSQAERRLHRDELAELYLNVARKYHHSAISIHSFYDHPEELALLMENIREKSGDEYFLILHHDPTYAIPDGDNMIDFTTELYEEPEKMKNKSRDKVLAELSYMEKFISRHPGLVDGIAMCSDYCFNAAPFFGPELFDEFIGPYLKEAIDGYRKMGLFTIKHTDGNIMPILERIVNCGPDAIHSLDPQGGVDLAEIKKRYGGQICLIGNVNCALLQTGTKEECIKDVRRSLTQGMPGYGYIFATSNCVYTGMPLERYELMHRIWREEGIYNET
jgi:uroporphyrinogen decarboxylase